MEQIIRTLISAIEIVAPSMGKFGTLSTSRPVTTLPYHGCYPKFLSGLSRMEGLGL